MEINIETISAVALGIGLSASTGFRVFIPLLVAGIASHFGLLPLGESFEWMGSVPALISFGVAAVAEVLAYYIPFVDNLLDHIATPLSIGAGTLLMTSVFPADNEWIRWIMGFVVGGGAAGNHPRAVARSHGYCRPASPPAPVIRLSPRVREWLRQDSPSCHFSHPSLSRCY